MVVHDKEYGELAEFYKENPTDKTWWTYPVGARGVILFSFDKKHIYNIMTDYPELLSPEEEEIFNKENPLWVQLRGRR